MLSYQVPAFVVDPDPICEVIYSAKVFDADGNDYPCAGCFDPLTQIFTFHFEADVDISGPDFKQFTVEVTGTSGVLNPMIDTASFALDIKNPCIDPSFVTVSLNDIPNQSYELFNFSPLGLQWTTQPCVI